MKFRNRSLVAMAVATAVLGASPLANASIVANFTDGNGNTLVDQYLGVPGLGWTTAWATNISGSNNLAPDGFRGTVTNVNPLNGGGNYLSSTLTTGTGTAQGKGAQVRSYGNYDGIDLSAPYTVKFSMRLDSDLSVLSGPTDYIQAFDLPGGASDFSGNGTWLIRAFGAPTGSNGQIPAHTWMLYDGLYSNTYNVNQFVSSGVTLVSGAVYDFTIDMDPVNLLYRVSINGGAFSDWLTYRRSTAPVGGSAINFGGQIAPNSEMSFSIDNIEIVPEPSTVALVLLGCGAAGVAAFRRRNPA
jgi:PEP-CTERM putative exosortase interaction domain